MTRPNRQNIYLPDHLRDYVADSKSLSGRISTIIDRYSEALRRTRIQKRFSDEELHHIKRACHSWLPDPAATVFGGIEIELEDEGIAPAELIAKVKELSPFEQVALVEWFEIERRSSK
jgi:hypothetical protein